MPAAPTDFKIIAFSRNILNQMEDDAPMFA